MPERFSTIQITASGIALLTVPGIRTASAGELLESVRRQFYEQVEPMHEQFVEPQKSTARRVLSSPPENGWREHLLLELQALTAQA